MDWNTQLSSILTEADSNMAKIKRLNATSITSKADLLLGRINTESAVLTEPQTGAPPLNFTCGVHPCCRMATEELSAITKQLHSQAQVIESLTQAVQRLKQEKELQQQSISHLEEKIDQLRHSSQGGLESVLGHRMEGLKSELRSLRQQVFQQSDGDCTPDPFSTTGIMQDMLESKKVLWQEYECIRREVEQLKHKLDQQEEDLFSQVSATHEIKKTQSQYCKMLEDLMNTHKAQTMDLDKARSETQSTQQELSHVKSTITDLKEQMKSLYLEDKLYTVPLKEKSIHLKKNKEPVHLDALFSLSDDSISEFSLTDVSSDELFSEPEIPQLDDDKISIPSLELEENTPGGAAGGMLEGAELSSELSTSLPELNLSDL
ncbi:uncharacterized protein LOC121928323 isoform X2 [Sceloporus undulatus]|uniref:uncharacterized protein LOC121928323 isoform X2 n=1 Tax=Sceloporus undulatus TaxID=8520 RepID=UPI001C4C5CCE|nr:uncharacterized protein LOC121928323 isoform X2 [Sceloporus undulatus]